LLLVLFSYWSWSPRAFAQAGDGLLLLFLLLLMKRVPLVWYREGFVLNNLRGCAVYLLDYTSEVEITDCVECKIFIGPVDGPALFTNSHACEVAVACQQFQAKHCTDCEFSVYSATGPTLSNCTDICFYNWFGSYKGIENHFVAAHLDPSKNQFDKVYDASQATVDVEGKVGGIPTGNYSISMMEPARSWHVDLNGVLEEYSRQNGGEEDGNMHENPVFERKEQSQAKESSVHRESAVKTAAMLELDESTVSKSKDGGKGIDGTEHWFSRTVDWGKVVSMVDLNRSMCSDVSRFKSVLLTQAGKLSYNNKNN